MPNEVDRTIHPHATGAAATTASTHAAEKPLKLYAGWFCPFVQRTWITLNEKSIDYQYIEINPYHKDPEFLKLNPRGLVPTLGVEVPISPSSITPAESPSSITPAEDQSTITNGNSTSNSKNGAPRTPKPRKLKPLYESLVIAEYLDEHYCNPSIHGPRLLPSGTDTLSSYTRAHCRLWIDHISTRIVPSFYRLLQHTPSKPYTLDSARAEFLAHIKTWVREVLEMDALRLENGEVAGPWFLGDRFSLVDVTLIPWALRVFLVEHYKGGGVGMGIIPGEGEAEEEEDEVVWRRWREWLGAVRRRESVMGTMSEEGRYVDVYRRYAEDVTGSQVGEATRGGRAMP